MKITRIESPGTLVHALPYEVIGPFSPESFELWNRAMEILKAGERAVDQMPYIIGAATVSAATLVQVN